MTERLMTSGPSVPRWTDSALVIPRAFAGLVLAIDFGASKLPVPEWFVTDVGNLGFPIPVAFAWAAVLTEVVGGIFLAAGFMTRPAAASIICTMLVAAFLQKAGDPLWERLPSLFFMVVAYYGLVLGGGRFSVDGWLRRRRGRA
jgi:putative oxidoreductase